VPPPNLSTDLGKELIFCWQPSYLWNGGGENWINDESTGESTVSVSNSLWCCGGISGQISVYRSGFGYLDDSVTNYFSSADSYCPSDTSSADTSECPTMVTTSIVSALSCELGLGGNWQWIQF
jgi:hypothetical protein